MKQTTWGGVFNDQDELKSKGMVRIAALAEWMNSGVKPRPDMIERRIKGYAKDYQMSEQEVKEMLSDASMAIKKGKTAYQYLKDGQPSHFLNAGKYMKYVRNITPEEYQSVQREISLSSEGQKMVLDSPDQARNYSKDEKQEVINSGKRPNFTVGEMVAGKLGQVF